MHHLGPRHQALRKKGVLPTIPRSKRVVSSVDVLAYIASFVSPLFTIDQVRLIWVEHNAEGVSMIAWVVYTLSSIIWLSYGTIHREKPIIISNILWVFFSVLVVAGVLIYG